MHLMYKSFVKGHWFWISNGEVEPQQYDFGYSNSKLSEVGGSSHINKDYNESYVDRMEYVVGDAIMTNQNVREKESSTWRQSFHNMVQAPQQPLYDGCSIHSELLATVRLLSIKSNYNIQQNVLMKLFN